MSVSLHDVINAARWIKWLFLKHGNVLAYFKVQTSKWSARAYLMLINHKSYWLLSIPGFLRPLVRLQIIRMLDWRTLYTYLLQLQQDQFGRLLPTFIQVINFTEQEESEYWAVVSAVFEGRQVNCITSRSKFGLVASTSMEAGINNKV